MMNQKLVQTSTLLTASLFPFVGAAQALDAQGDMTVFLGSVLTFINNTAIPFLLGLGFLFFVWGMFKYFIVGGANEEKRAEGKNLIIYATSGFVLIFIFWGIVQLATNATGLRQPVLPPDLIPQVPGGR